MSVSLQGGDYKATNDNRRHGKRTIPVVVPIGGIEFSAGFEYCHKLSDVKSIAPLVASFIEEEELFEGGSDVILVNSGTEWESTVTLEGDAIEAAASLVGHDLTAIRTLEYGKDYGECFHLAIYSVEDTMEKPLRVCSLLTFVGVKLNQMPAVAENTKETYELTLYGKTSRGYRIHGGNSVSFECWYDNSVNSAAPNGVLTVFTLGDGNDSYATAAAPDILPVDGNAASSLYQYLYYVTVNGVLQRPSEVTFNPTTKELTFATAPANNAKIEVAYCVDVAGTGPLGQPAHLWSGSSFLNNWKGFQQ